MRYLPRRNHLAALAAAMAFAGSASAQVNVTVDATTTVRLVDDRMFGLNTATWDGAYSDPQTLAALKAVDARFLRFPGGSTSDDFNWQTTTLVEEGGGAGATTFDDFATYATAIGAQVVITTNYGTGTPALAAAWVQYSNVTKMYGFRYWEVGNECYGTWEDDTQALAHDPVTYANRAVQYIQAMKAVDPTIKVGVVADASEDSYINGYTHVVTNPVTNATHSGWTPVMLTTMKAAGVLPDFLIYHYYAQDNGLENDASLLQNAGGASGWSYDATELRMQLTDYLGTAGAGIELLVTENNSVDTNPGKQTTSLVNGLYLADSVGSLMQTEFNSLIWWDLHNGQETGNNNSSALYGWRMYGDYGIESPTHDQYPTYYVMKLMANFARGGDKVVKATSDNPLLSAYSVVRANGTLSILVINKDPATTYSANFTLTGYSPVPTANVYSYGIPQDTAAENGTGSTDVAMTTITSAAASFSQSFAPYSVTLLSLSTPTATPVALSQPTSQTLASGSTVVFSFSASGTPTPTYQWYRNGVAIPSGTSATLVVGGATAANAGTYTCTAMNVSGSVTSNDAVLAIVTTSNPGRLVNISCRSTVGTGANILIAGFAVGGAGTSGTESLLIRGSGPALVPFGVSGTLADPELALYSGTTLLGSNSGWDGAAAISSAAAAVGAFAWSDPSSHDAALLESLPGGPYTAQISGESGDTGIALAEVYDATPAGSYSLATPRIVNISARVQVGTGGNILIAGFAIGGGTSKTVLIRASGPALAPFGVTGTLPDPQLQLYSGTTVLQGNNGWGGNAQITAVAASVGAFAWTSASSKDSAILVTLPPGAYTVQVSGASGDTGIALVEVYEVQ
jgi:alpha-L-arabinofuranosidase